MAKGDIPGVRFKVVMVSGVICVAWLGKHEFSMFIMIAE